MLNSKSIALAAGLLALLASAIALSGDPFSQARQEACPDAWAFTNQEIPIIKSPIKESPWAVSAEDKAGALNHLANVAQVVDTIDAEPVSDQHRVNDLLTVASECLIYRNSAVDLWDYSSPPPAAPADPSKSWMPVVIF